MEASNIQQSNSSEGHVAMKRSVSPGSCDSTRQVSGASDLKKRRKDNKMDTVTRARQERENNGPWEAEISYGGEADLQRHLDGCEKNPGHLNFVPVDQFDVDRLPPGCQDNLLVEMTRALSDQTVRMSVKYVSEGRPETFPGSGKPYPFYKNRGRDMMRVGTGWVVRVDIFPDKYDNPTCGCKECLDSPTPKTQFARIVIRTAAHVVWDGLEGADTTCHLFFDRGGTPDACEGVVALSGMSRVRSGIVGDRSWMEHETHDLDLAHRLHKMAAGRDYLMEKVEARYGHRGYRPPGYRKLETGSEPGPLEELAIIVSHPHGCSKQVSVGYWVNGDGGLKQVTYTTATCPGSSGARVWGVGEEGGFSPVHVHSGNCEGKKDVNFGFWAWAFK